MTQQAAGFQWLIQHFGFSQYRLTHRSYIGTRNKAEVTRDGTVEEIYGSKYAPADETITAHLEFALKYDDLNLDLIRTVFRSMDINELTVYILGNPSGRYSRKIGFLYEWLTGKHLEIESEINGNYIDLLDGSKYITGSIQKNSRWRINDNLLGGAGFCPLIRKNASIKELFPNRRKKHFPEITEEEFQEIERIYQTVFS